MTNQPKTTKIAKGDKTLIDQIKVMITKGTVQSHMYQTMLTKVQVAMLNQNRTLN
jgi:glutamate racemase